MNFGIKLPFGMSNVSNPNPNPTVNNPGGNTGAKPLPKVTDQNNNTLNPGNANANAGNTNEPNNDPNANADPAKGQGSQLDNFKDLFTIPTDATGKPIVHTDPLAGPLLSVNPEKLREAASKMNFTAGISPELLVKAMSGNDPQAFMEAINTAAQGAFLQAMQVNAGVVENAFSKHTTRMEAALPDRIRNVQIGQAVPTHPALSHPAAAPMVAALKMQIAANNPTLSPDRVASMAENYVIAMASDINAENTRQDTVKANAADKSVDWMALLGG